LVGGINSGLKCKDFGLLEVSDVWAGATGTDSCPALASTLTELLDEFQGPGEHEADYTINCFGDILSVEGDECSVVEDLLNEMMEAYLYGAFGGCQITTPTTTPL
jgi:hypothetical protein